MTFTSAETKRLWTTIEDLYTLRPYPDGIAGMQDVDGRVFVFHEVNDKALLKHIEQYKPPEAIDDNFEPWKGCLNTYLKNIYPWKVLEASAKYFRKMRKQLPELADVDSSHIDVDDGGREMNSWDNKIVAEQIQTTKSMFRKMLTPREAVLWDLVDGTYTLQVAAKALYPDMKLDKALTDRINHQLNHIRFRFACLLSTRDLYSPRVLLKLLNSIPVAQNKVFGSKKLEALPPNVDLLRAARGEIVKKAGERKVQGSWEKVSKIDFNGKEHSHFVVYRAPSGLYYDQITKTTRTQI